RPSSTPERPTGPGSVSTSVPASRTSAPARTTSSSTAREVVASVRARDDWTFVNVTVHRGDRIQVSATGKVKISTTRDSGPEGVNIEDKNKLMLDRPTGALIAVIGDDNDEFIFIGRDNEFVAQRDGKLFLSINQ